MKSVFNRIITLSTCFLLVLSFAVSANAQLQSILTKSQDAKETNPEIVCNSEVDGEKPACQATEQAATETTPCESEMLTTRVMQANRPSVEQAVDQSSVNESVGASADASAVTPASMTVPAQDLSPNRLPQAPLVSIRQLNDEQYGAQIKDGMTVFEVQNLGAVEAKDVTVDIEIAHPAKLISVEPFTTVVASRSARVRLDELPSGAQQQIKIVSETALGSQAQFTARVSMATVQQFGTPPKATAQAGKTNNDHQPKFDREPQSWMNTYKELNTPDKGAPEEVAPAEVDAEEVAAKEVEETESVPPVPEEPVIIKLDGPKQVLVGMPYKIFATVQNPTSATIKNLELIMKTSADLKNVPGFTNVQKVGHLLPRHTAKFEFAFYGTRQGSVELAFDAKGRFGDQTEESKEQQVMLSTSDFVEIMRPEIRGEFTGPDLIHVGTEGEYSITLMNESGIELPGTDVILTVPDGLMVTVLDRVAYRRGTEQINWKLDPLQPGQSETIQFKARAMKAGMQSQEVSIALNERIYSSGTCQTNVLGPSQMKLTINDPQNPIAIGEVTKVRLNLENDNDYDSQVNLTVMLPEGIDALNSDQFKSVQPGKVVFKEFLLSRKTETDIEFAIVGSQVGGKRIAAEVRSTTTKATCKAEHHVVFTNPQQEIVVEQPQTRPIEAPPEKPRIVGQRMPYIDYSRR